MRTIGITVTLLLAAMALKGFGQSPPGIGEFYQAGREMHSYYYSFSNLSLVLGSIVGLLGALRVYTNWQQGRHHIDAQVTGWFFSCLFLLLTGVFLRGLFGL
jgi:formate hydrogenlyase subunit 3/multisubunit Na+/H+ antiporter MnhD subunit